MGASLDIYISSFANIWYPYSKKKEKENKHVAQSHYNGKRKKTEISPYQQAVSSKDRKFSVFT